MYSGEAELRNELVSNVTYTLALKLGGTLEEGYSGSYRVTFNLKEKTGDSLFLDFQGKKIENTLVNGTASAGVKFDSHRISLPWADLSTDETNTVSFDFDNSYVVNSAGLHFYKDP